MLCIPFDKNEVEYFATPAIPMIPSSIVVLPSLKMTRPVGIPIAGETALTVVVNVIDWPRFDGFNEDIILLELSPFLPFGSNCRNCWQNYYTT